MPIADPRECRDHAEDWTEYFYQRRGAEINDLITDELIEEHHRNSDQALGQHSADLHLVLNYFRAAPIIGKEFVYTVIPHQEYRIGVVTARGTAPTMLNDAVYPSEKEAVHAVFMARVSKLRKNLGI
jgi:hypothetical protein